MEEKKYKSGFVNIVGNPNVGKSTLMNKLVGEKLSIITAKAQTTRHRILGVVNEANYQGFGVSQIMDEIVEMLPEGTPYFPTDALTDKPERFFVSEIIREKILLNYQKEVPYSVEVVVESFKEEETIIRIGAIINVARETQKGIIIGHQGKALKKVGTQARKDLEVFFGKKVFLELFVKVIKNWRDNEQDLKRFGYYT